MRDNEFADLADRALAEIERKLEASGLDLDCSPAGDGVLEIEFGDGGRIVVNRHLASREVWVAARSGGVHFRWDGEAWRDTRDGRELMAVLSELVSAHAGTPKNASGKR
ncbi:MAG: iron donor protein CyaY [Candidatus Accumulibacter sp.]|jgi:CyaY protein|nr:iron donor protein CyaY [Accumulibacter sp.]